MNNVSWLDGQSSAGQFVMQIHYSSGGAGFLKNESYDWLMDHYNIFRDCPEVVGFTIYNPTGKIVFETAAKAA